MSIILFWWSRIICATVRIDPPTVATQTFVMGCDVPLDLVFVFLVIGRHAVPRRDRPGFYRRW